MGFLRQQWLPQTCATLLILLAGSWGPALGLEYAKWAKIELTLRGPDSIGLGDPNPFAMTVDAVFTAPSGRSYTIPGYYDGDGRGGLDGDVWKIRFAADEVGQWTYRTQSKARLLDNQTGAFTVTPAPREAPDYYRWGRLEAVGTPQSRIRYLKFRDGPYWLKAGCDDPENFLGSYQHYDTLAKRQAAIDYLAERGINSLYIMSHNVDGDDKDVWPWIGATAREAKQHSRGDVRFDLKKLDEWRAVFEYMQQRGLVVYLILEDDSAWKQYDHARYYREIVARFGDLPALVFNLGEEHNENYRLAEGLVLAGQLAEIDPYNHPRGIHNVNAPHNDYIDSPHIDFTAIQTGTPGSQRGLEHALHHHQIALDWLARCAARGRRTLVVNFDEGRPELNRAAWWAVYLAGGVWEAHVLPPYDRPMSAWEKTWNELGGARTFLESLPFWEMEPHDELVKPAASAFCLAKPGEAYALYLPHGGQTTVELAPERRYTVQWWNPANSRRGEFEHRSSVGGGPCQLIAPGPGDWAVRIAVERE